MKHFFKKCIFNLQRVGLIFRNVLGLFSTDFHTISFYTTEKKLHMFNNRIEDFSKYMTQKDVCIFLKILGKRTQYNSSTFWRNNGILHQKSFNADPPKIWVLDLLVTFFSIIQQRLVRERAINMLYIYILTCQMSIKWWILFTACSRHEHWLKLILILQTRSDKIL